MHGDSCAQRPIHPDDPFVKVLSPFTAMLRRLPFATRLRASVARFLDGSRRTDPHFLISRCVLSPNAQVVQIGSNDGKTNDPLRRLLLSRRHWQALLVEPVPSLFTRLVSNYPAEPRFVFENVAITLATNATFYWVDPSAQQHIPALPPWYDQLGSFDRSHITKHLNGVLEPFIVSAPLQCLTLSELLARHAVHRIDVLHIDTEGHDWQVLSQLNLVAHAPDIILYEHRHLSPDDKKRSIEFLAGTYDIYDLGRDYFAVTKTTGAKRRRALAGISDRRIHSVSEA